MIIVTNPSKPFLYTAKGTIRRQAIINEYEEEINAAYDTVDGSSQIDVTEPSTWDFASVKSFVRQVFDRTLKSGMLGIDDNMDLFEVGLDRQAAIHFAGCVHL